MFARTADRARDGAGAGPPQDPGPMVDIHGVDVTFQTKDRTVHALSGIDLTIQHGEFLSIAGPSGCGKSTLLRVIAGLTGTSAGGVTLRGTPVTGPRRDVGFVFQRAALLDWRNARDNILFQAEMRGLPKAWARKRTDELMEMTGLTGFEKAMPFELSGGMQQRVSLCRALLHEPDVLLMDEPFGALDALTRENMNVELRRIWEATGMTVVLVTHSVAEAVYLASRSVVMGPRPGRVIEEFDIAIPGHREYEPTLENPEFQRVTARIRELLGSTATAD
ncbi:MULTISPECIES: ABC transporter ATP-binding protein [unclassified Nocardiopsis]|jgi:NitT/TauT family transport system ATP-binding protein|uniref:ABC transporter ATP-binding protein n=1 Tax=unclassified Nocardiopsis TaxID=2649073 RepID=UPI000AA8BB68|nr:MULTISPECIES: ABC transporter ATP-binding protein [unclassified Nocardiopsis]MBQ1081024.1 ABC transporter ATP-binding protein [Nocardiopsis sp. B62]